MLSRSLKTLEFDKIVVQLVEKANCCVSRELAAALTPASHTNDVRTLLEITSEAETVFKRTGYTPVDDFPDIRNLLARLKAVLFLSPAELLNIARCLRASRLTRESLAKESTGHLLTNLARRINTYDYIENEINRCVLSEEELHDNASPALSRIRKHMRLANEKVREKLNSMIRSTAYQKYLQEPLITVRNGRFVIPVKQEFRMQVPGLIHDQSGSGQTLFIEPTAAVELGNEFKRLQAEESAEVERILTELTAMAAPAANEMLENLNLMGEIDLAFAKARLASDMNAVAPILTNNSISIVRGRHPLIAQNEVVPIDVWLGDVFSTLIITGPNTGGKTVTLKTVGLFTLMAMAGLFVPANYGTKLCVFDNVFADIGDEQSIEQSLSTFSSHMKNIVEILKNATESSLVLLDELGAGTDPVEGAALAMSILENLHAVGCKIVATTHYSEIKAFALSREGMENASMEFDINRLCPTYRLFIGIPGKSNAFEISKRLGLSDGITNRAREFLKKEDIQFEDIISNADESRKIAEREKALAAQARDELYRLREEAERQRLKLEEDSKGIIRKAREEARNIVKDTKHSMEQLVKSLRELKTDDRSGIERAIQDARDALRDTEKKFEPAIEKKDTDAGAPPKTVKPGDSVKIISVDKEGVVLTAPDSKSEVSVRVGLMKLNVKLSDLRVVDSSKETVSTRAVAPKSKLVPLETDIRGMMVEEAIPIIDAYIEDAYLAGLNEISIIHGKGTGALRAGVQEFARRHPRVKSFRMGSYGQGDAGVTVVTIKK